MYRVIMVTISVISKNKIFAMFCEVNKYILLGLFQFVYSIHMVMFKYTYKQKVPLVVPNISGLSQIHTHLVSR